jgi:hypothetical protein
VGATCSDFVSRKRMSRSDTSSPTCLASPAIPDGLRGRPPRNAWDARAHTWPDVRAHESGGDGSQGQGERRMLGAPRRGVALVAADAQYSMRERLVKSVRSKESRLGRISSTTIASPAVTFQISSGPSPSPATDLVSDCPALGGRSKPPCRLPGLA